MTGKTSIEWTHMPGFEGDVWNPTTGCTRVSAGCDNCYAFALHDRRYKSNADAALVEYRAGLMDVALKPAGARARGMALPWPRQYDLPFSRVQLLEDRLDAPLRKRKPTCYFVDSMSDLFHESVPFDFIDKVWTTMIDAPQHRFLVLTKRPERMFDYVLTHCPESAARRAPNIWLGTSVEDQRAADERIPHLLATPAAVRFLSCEPLLGPLDLETCQYLEESDVPTDRESFTMPGLDWVVCGGESGPRARPMDLAWSRSLRDQCAAAGVSFFMKQDSGPKPGMRGRIEDGLWIKQWPR